MKKSIKITTLAFAATLSTISAATVLTILCSKMLIVLINKYI